jgi:hypothetical protein
MRSFAPPRVIRSKVVSGCALDGKWGDSSSPKLYITPILTCLPSNGSHIRRVRAHMPYNRNVWQPSAKFLSIARKSGRIIQSSREKRIPSKLVRTYQAWSIYPFSLCCSESMFLRVSHAIQRFSRNKVETNPLRKPCHQCRDCKSFTPVHNRSFAA